jgi:hypothetical protein
MNISNAELLRKVKTAVSRNVHPEEFRAALLKARILKGTASKATLILVTVQVGDLHASQLTSFDNAYTTAKMLKAGWTPPHSRV